MMASPGPHPVGPDERCSTHDTAPWAVVGVVTGEQAARRPLHPAARIENAVHALVGRRLRSRGWRPAVVPYTGYGTGGWVRVLARVMLQPPGTPAARAEDPRGWRAFLASSSGSVDVRVRVGGRTHVVTTLRDGYVDVRLPSELPAGWATAELSVDGSPSVEAPLRIVGDQPGLGLLSDIDDTVIVTMLPRPLRAFWNAFVVRASERRPVPGMAELYRQIQDTHQDVVTVYLSTGAWNTAPAIRRFLDRHGYPAGPLLMTDWGPTRDRWFRSGSDHKRTELARLMRELPQLRWLLVGDDGQHDPTLYAEAAAAFPDAVVGVAIRQLSTSEQVLTHGSPVPKDAGAAGGPSAADQVHAPDGFALASALRRRGLVLGGKS